MRAVHVNVVQPRGRTTPEQLLANWPTLRTVAAAVGRSGVELSVVQAFHQDAERIVDGVRYRFVAEPRLTCRASGAMPWRVVSAVREARPDVIHVNGLDFACHTRTLCHLGVPVLAQDHASVPERRPAWRRWGLAHVAGLAFTDAAQADPLRVTGSLPQHVPVFEVPEVSTHFSAGERERAREISGVFGDPAVLWIGRLDTNKDPLTILNAIEIAARSLPEVTLWCCFHEHPLMSQIKARLAASSDLARRVHLLGRLPHARIETLCQASDFLMIGSHRESCGTAVLEALACGATPIVSDIVPFRRLTANGSIGAIAETGNAAAFAAQLVRLAAIPSEQRRKRAIAHFQETLSFERIGEQLREIYATLMRGMQ